MAEANNTSKNATVSGAVKRKRRRTRSHNSSPSPGRGFIVPGFENNEKMSLSEVMDAAKGITNMYLAHEIAINKDFMIQDFKSNETEVEQKVKEAMKKAFWDLLDHQLKEEPPNYSQAIVLLGDVKKAILSLLAPYQKRTIDSINEKLDIDLIKQQIENETIEFQTYADYVLTVMAQLCAPVRDEKINELKNIKDIVPLFRGILETIDLMKLDMANFHIQQARPLIVSQSVEYEKTKFAEFLKTQKNGLQLTKEWLKRHAPTDNDVDDPKYYKLYATRILTDSYVELLEWDEYYELPETLAMDQKRILSLRDSTERTAVSTAVILLVFSHVSSLIIPMHAQKLKETIKKHVDILLEDFFDDTDLLKILPSVSVQVVKDLNDYFEENDKPVLQDTMVKTLEDKIVEMEDPNHKIRDLVQRRIIEFSKQAITASRSAPLQVPPGLTLCQRELAHIAGNFVRIVNYNRAVFGDYYQDIIDKDIFGKTNNEQPNES